MQGFLKIWGPATGLVGEKVQVAKRPRGESSWWRIVLVANRPEGETSTIGGETSRGRNVKVAKHPVTLFYFSIFFVLFID